MVRRECLSQHHFDRGLGARAGAEILIGVAGPMTGTDAWFGEQMERGAALAVADLNAAGGVLGQRVQLITADDFCDPEQAVAAARKLVSDGVIFVAGHYCSGASIPASKVYEAAGILMISPASTNPMLTELGRPTSSASAAGTTGKGAWSAITWPIIGPTRRSRSWMTARPWGRALPTRSRSSCTSGVTERSTRLMSPARPSIPAMVSRRPTSPWRSFVGGYHRRSGLMVAVARDRGYGFS